MKAIPIIPKRQYEHVLPKLAEIEDNEDIQGYDFVKLRLVVMSKLV